MSRLDAYLKALPNGLASYPKCQQKAVLYRGFMRQVDLTKVTHRLPPELRDLIESPRNDSDWISEVHGIGLWLAACDLVLDNEEALLETVYRMNRDVMTSALYRIVFMVVSPSILLLGASARWLAFHRGSKLQSKGKGRGTIRLLYPDQLFPELVAKVYARVFDAVLESAGSIEAKVTLSSWKPTLATYDAIWS